MPELPEVETVVTVLKRELIGKKIINVVVYFPKTIKNYLPNEFVNTLVGQTINDIKRKGKHIIFLLDNFCLINHLRMEGKFFILERHREFDNFHVLATFLLSNDKLLIYHDTRKFGTFHLYSIDQYRNNQLLTNIGYEPFDERVTVKYLKNKWKNKKKEIKAVLLEQNVICGIGNIYACEALYDAKINPFKATNQLTNKELQRLIQSVRKILTKAIKAGGSTISSFSGVHGISGKFQNELLVYQKNGQKCRNCNAIIMRRKLGGRGTFFCPKEQKVTKEQLKKYSIKKQKKNGL